MLIFALSKELIIIGLMNVISSSFLFYLTLVGAIGTIIYSFILIYFIFFSTSFSNFDPVRELDKLNVLLTSVGVLPLPSSILSDPNGLKSISKARGDLGKSIN
jgi:NADH:ubiquinone oxidoreductase subunit 5 (subunit L)/multisubunit Na+/H+ antiporter MnhA subunit